MRYTGTLKIWNDERGFGFLEPTQGGPEIFVHIKAFPLSTGRPFVGQVLTYEIETSPDGKKKARAVQFPLRAKQRPQQRYETVAPWTLPRALAIPIFIGIYIYVVIRWGFSLPVLLTYLGLSILAFLIYTFDKSAAVSGQRRTPEKTLLLISIAGGWPGALLAQQLLRHKTSKRSFIFAFWLTVFINVIGFVVWHANQLHLHS